MSYRVQFTPSAARALRRLPRSVQTRIRDAIDGLGAEPRPHGTRKLWGVSDFYRIRVGDYRVIYEIRDEILVVVVVRIATRQQVYKRR